MDKEAIADFHSNYNTDIGNTAIIISNDAPERFSLGMFGYTPFWEKGLKYIFNARCEGDFNKENSATYNGELGIFVKPYFRGVIQKKRCVVPVNYFVEGPEKERLKKPYVIKRSDERPFLLGGIWEDWTDKNTGEIIRTFAIITTAHIPILAKVGHHRSPLIIPKDRLEWWLDPNRTASEIGILMHPYLANDFIAYPVSPEIRRRNFIHSNNDPALIHAIGESITV